MTDIREVATIMQNPTNIFEGAVSDHNHALQPTARPPIKHISAAVIGLAIEYYDFVIYAFFAVMIGRTFFPSADPATSLLLTLSTFAAGSLMRPLGGIVIGGYADRKGRKAALLVTIVMMTIGSVGIGLTPSYASIGIAAPIILVIARLLQGLAMGGEVGTATSFIAEIAPPHRRNLYMGAMGAVQGFATLVAGVVGYLLADLLSPDELDQWGWRLPFLLGLLIVPVGVYIRRTLPETLEISTEDREHAPLVSLFRDHLGTVTMAFFAFGSLSVSIYVTMYMTTFSISVLHLPPNIAMIGTIALGVVSTISMLIAGALADRFGSRIMCILPMSLLLVLPYPAFAWLVAEPGILTLTIASAIVGIPAFMSALTVIALLPQLLPSAVRATGVSLAYAMGASVFGGTAQLVVAWLVDFTGSPYVPAYYLMGANLVGLLAVISLSRHVPSTAPAS